MIRGEPSVLAPDRFIPLDSAQATGVKTAEKPYRSRQFTAGYVTGALELDLGWGFSLKGRQSEKQLTLIFSIGGRRIGKAHLC